MCPAVLQVYIPVTFYADSIYVSIPSGMGTVCTFYFKDTHTNKEPYMKLLNHLRKCALIYKKKVNKSVQKLRNLFGGGWEFINRSHCITEGKGRSGRSKKDYVIL